ncbi:hypothetical protein B1A99_24460 [Cohnella sp. CIP 111063]|uniref:murein hydrolase activator EnvC family protein n=1 Tax=unclassified Cohnella TaxID=2636738 RepID=UPI000B8C424D|nr:MULTISPECIES: M23 family metallopeptidase [unclassified Cohnella]OXS54938.1 hypothetical protein B1A99_24460 [Cohnella sp. CIP 111063]
MAKKRFFIALFFTLFIVTGSISYAVVGNADTELERINNELRKLEQQIEREKMETQESEQELKAVNQEIKTTEQELKQVMNKMEKTGKEIEKFEREKENLTLQLEQLSVKLEATQFRINQRREFIDARIRSMYTEGQVSYLNVLLSSNSISDFLGRMDNLVMLVKQDQRIVEQNKSDQDQVGQQKAEIDSKLAQAITLIRNTEQLKSDLKKQENEKSIMISSLSERSEAIADISEEQEETLIRLASQQAKLLKQREEASQSKKAFGTGGNFVWPFDRKYPITSNYGYRTHPITGEKESFHKGIDIGAPGGTSILAAGSGSVIIAQWMSGYGNTVIIDHGKGIWTLYAHIRMNGIKVEKGEQVKQGQKIAEVGSTGNSTGNHLHFEVRENEEAQDPVSYL